MHGGGASPDPPRATEWDVDFGSPSGSCKASSADGVFTRDWTKATVTWDCATNKGEIKMKPGFEHELESPPLAGRPAWDIERRGAL